MCFVVFNLWGQQNVMFVIVIFIVCVCVCGVCFFSGHHHHHCLLISLIQSFHHRPHKKSTVNYCLHLNISHLNFIMVKLNGEFFIKTQCDWFNKFETTASGSLIVILSCVCMFFSLSFL